MLLKYEVNQSFAAIHKAVNDFQVVPGVQSALLECWFAKGLALYLFLRSTCIGMSRNDIYVLHKGLRLLFQRPPLDAILIQFPIRCFTHLYAMPPPHPPSSVPVLKINFFSRVF